MTIYGTLELFWGKEFLNDKTVLFIGNIYGTKAQLNVYALYGVQNILSLRSVLPVQSVLFLLFCLGAGLHQTKLL